MFRKIFIVTTFAILFVVFSGSTYSQRAHVGFYISTPGISIVSGEPSYWPYYPPVYYRHHHRVYYSPYRSYYYHRPYRHYYGYRHDNGLHRGWYKHERHHRR